MLLELKEKCTYGPVRSRRLGRSLGINVLPSRRKICSFNCIYCQYGFADPVSLDQASSFPFPTAGAVLAEVEQVLADLEPRPAYLTFSGNGEATLHPEFPAMVQGLITIRDRLAPSSRTAILSNASTVDREEIRAALRQLDERIMKLDAGTTPMLEAYNGPCEGLDLERIIEGLATLEGVTLQALFADGPRGNLGEDHLEPWIEAVRTIAPVAVQVYTLARPSPSKEILPASAEALEAIVDRLHRQNIR